MRFPGCRAVHEVTPPPSKSPEGGVGGAGSGARARGVVGRAGAAGAGRKVRGVGVGSTPEVCPLAACGRAGNIGSTLNSKDDDFDFDDDLITEQSGDRDPRISRDTHQGSR